MDTSHGYRPTLQTRTHTHTRARTKAIKETDKQAYILGICMTKTGGGEDTFSSPCSPASQLH